MEKHWYVVNTYSGHENKVKTNLDMRAETMNMQDYIFRVIVPTQEEEVDNKKKIKKMFPGYILVEMIMSDDAWYVVRNTPGVTGFIGSSGGGAKPVPLLDSEIENILKSMNIKLVENNVTFTIGASVKIVKGAFENQFGTIEKIDEDNEVLNLLIDLFGRETPIEVNFDEVDVI